MMLNKLGTILRVILGAFILFIFARLGLGLLFEHYQTGLEAVIVIGLFSLVAYIFLQDILENIYDSLNDSEILNTILSTFEDKFKKYIWPVLKWILGLGWVFFIIWSVVFDK